MESGGFLLQFLGLRDLAAYRPGDALQMREFGDPVGVLDRAPLVRTAEFVSRGHRPERIDLLQYLRAAHLSRRIAQPPQAATVR